MRTGLFLLFVAMGAVALHSCKKDDSNNDGTGGGANNKMYSDSIFYIKSASYVVNPLVQRTGTYTAFPDNLLIDPVTGAITVQVMGKAGESQTGLRYKIRFEETGTGVADSTYIILAGINYLDRIYRLSQNDTIIRPVYNAALTTSLPSGTYGIQPDNRLSINSTNGEINIAACIRKGMFDLPVENGEWEEVSINYRSQDGSNAVTNRIDIALYYYDRVQDIPSNVSQLMRKHQSMVLGVDHQPIPVTSGPVDTDLPDNISLFKPRPPCVIIVGD